MGAPHAVCWLKLFVFAFKQVFCIFPSLTEKKERKATQKHAIKTVLNIFKEKITFSPGVDQLLGVNQLLRLTPKRL